MGGHTVPLSYMDGKGRMKRVGNEKWGTRDHTIEKEMEEGEMEGMGEGNG